LGFLEDRAFHSTPAENTDTMRGFYGRFLLPLRAIPVPTVCAVNGHAIGAAFSFAMATDLRVISETAKCAVNFTALGLHPGMGATWVLPRTASREVANYLLLTGKQVSGRETHQMGLCLRCVPADQVLAEATTIAVEIAAAGRLAVRQTKESLGSLWEEGLERQLRREADAQAISYVGDEFKTRLAALVARTTKKTKAKL
jgi:enoyl-CoA hydratase/carnithine racemase